MENVKEEVKYQVRRLQNHPSIALWCGNNEVDEAIVNWGYQKQFKYTKEDSLQVWKDYRKVFHEAIPQALKETLTPDNNIYWPSSPSIGWGIKKALRREILITGVYGGANSLSKCMKRRYHVLLQSTVYRECQVWRL